MSKDYFKTTHLRCAIHHKHSVHFVGFMHYATISAQDYVALVTWRLLLYLCSVMLLTCIRAVPGSNLDR
jgi:hypothetical protein